MSEDVARLVSTALTFSRQVAEIQPLRDIKCQSP
jgi:hypothetical protein